MKLPTWEAALLTALFVASGAPAPSSAQETQTIIDHAGRSVEAPKSASRILTNFMPFPSAFFIATGSVDRLVGIAATSHNMAQRSMFGRIAPSVLDIPTDFASGTSVNIEEILKLNPDVIVTFEGNPELPEIERTGIPTLAMAISSASQFKGDVIDTFEGWVSIIGQLTGEHDRASEIIAFARQTESEIANRLEGLPEEKRPSALYFQYLDENALTVSAKGYFGNYWLKETGAHNLAEEGVGVPKGFGTVDIDMETIYRLNPQVIYITNFSATKPDDLYENRIPGQDWSHVDAVKNQRVYKVPEGIFQWTPPSADAPLMLKWIAQKNQPALFADYEIEDEIAAYYSRFYDYELTDEDIRLILDPTF